MRVIPWLLKFYIVFLIAEIVVFVIRCKRTPKHPQTLSASKAMHCIASFLSIMTATALCLNLLSFDSEYLWFYILFGAMVLISVPLMLYVFFWKIEYTNELLIYRNFIGIKRKYPISDVWLKYKKENTIIMKKEKRVTDYTIFSVNIFDAIQFEAFIEKRNSHSASKR